MRTLDLEVEIYEDAAENQLLNLLRDLEQTHQIGVKTKRLNLFEQEQLSKEDLELQIERATKGNLYSYENLKNRLSL